MLIAMKKAIVLTLIAVFAAAFPAFAQSAKEVKQSDVRVAKILKLTLPRPCGLKSIDDMIVTMTSMARNAAKISVALKAHMQNPTPESGQSLKRMIEDEAAAAESMDAQTMAMLQSLQEEVDAMSDEEAEQLSPTRFLGVLLYTQKLAKLLIPEIEYHEAALKAME